MIIAIEGLIGSGKSTVLRELQKRGYNVRLEPVDRWTFLDNFYKNPKKYALPLQVQILLSFAEFDIKENEVTIVERSPQVSRSVFAKMLAHKKDLTDEQMSVYTELFDHVNPWKPDVFINLDCPVDVCMSRIEHRGDTFDITREYMTDLQKYYEIFMRYTDNVRVDSNRSVEDVVDDIVKIIDSCAA
ncbi:kinase protein [Paramecium bursaria Chlorella virus NE-JV-1]|nr:kinase protein [Paramecium bursaria Chlorella virus NE-JV-1]